MDKGSFHLTKIALAGEIITLRCIQMQNKRRNNEDVYLYLNAQLRKSSHPQIKFKYSLESINPTEKYYQKQKQVQIACPQIPAKTALVSGSSKDLYHI